MTSLSRCSFRCNSSLSRNLSLFFSSVSHSLLTVIRVEHRSPWQKRSWVVRLVKIGLTLLFLSFVVAGQSDDPVDDFFIVEEPTWLEITNNDPNPRAPYIFSYPSHGSVVVYWGNAWPRYSPNSGYTGFDQFSYRYINLGGEWSNSAAVRLILIGNDDRQNAGTCPVLEPDRGAPSPPSTPMEVGEPINVTNGNMWLVQRDYALGGRGEPVEIDRFYNSMIQSSGLFGFGWSTGLDESIQLFGDKMIRYLRSDGKAIYFGRSETNLPYFSFSPAVFGTISANPDGTFKLSFRNGSSRLFNSTGKLVSISDRQGNETVLTYNAAGVLDTVTDAVGRVLTLTSNANGTIASIADSSGTIAAYEYETNPSLLKTVTYPDGSKYKFEYVTVGTKKLLATVKDALDNVLEHHDYDSQGRAITSEKHGGVEKYTLNYSGWDSTHGNFTSVTDALGNVTKYFHKRIYGTNIVTRTEGVCGGCGGSGSEVTTYEYDTGNSWLALKKRTDALGRQTHYSYDQQRNLIRVVDPLGTQNWSYNQFGQVLTYRDRVDSQTSNPGTDTLVNTYDPDGNLLTSEDSLGNVTSFSYDQNGQLISVTNARNHATTFSYDAFGRVTGIVDANGKTTSIGYDSRSRVSGLTNSLNENTAFEYDPKGRLKKIIYPDLNFTEITYDLAGRRTAVRDARGNITALGYDNAYRLTSVTDPLNHSTTFGYDLMSQMTSVTDALGNTTNFEYDSFQRVKKIIYPPAATGATRREEMLTYDKVGNVKTRVDTAGRTTGFDYDTSNRLIKITDPALKLTQFEYNLRSQLTKVKDALNQEYLFTYDPLGRVLSQTRAGTTMSFEYDAVGNRILRTDHMGRRTAYEYDALDRLTEIEYLPTLGVGIQPPPAGMPNAMATYAYDDLSRLVSATNSSGTVAFAYDNRGRLRTETDVFGNVIEFGYDANGNRTQLKLNGNVHTTYAYDAANRLTTLTDDTSQSFTYAYDIADRLISKALPNGVTTTYEYDGMSRLKRLKHQSATAVLFDNNFTYNASNQIVQITEPLRTRTFTYDDVDRLTGVTDASSTESYTYNAVGSRTASYLSDTYSYQPFNRVTSTQTASYAYDSNGNLVSKSEGSKRWSYLWDHENRLASVSDRKTRQRHIFDALGRRVLNFGGPNGSTRFTYDGLDVLMDDSSVSGERKYQNSLNIDDKLKLTDAGSSRYFLKDHLGSTVGLTDSVGGITSTAIYDSFGNSGNDPQTRYRYTGREYDSFSGLYFYRARWYDPKLGRFLSEDPIGFAGGDINLYGYVRNQPYIFRDPMGLYPGVDVMANPNIWGPAAASLAAAGGAILSAAGAVASSPAFVAGAGFGAGVAIGYYPGQWTANHPSNPFVNGPWNPWGTPAPMLPPFPIPNNPPQTTSGPVCQPLPKAVPWNRDRTIPWPDPNPERSGCAEEWARAYEWCAENIGRRDQRGGTGGYTDLQSCARGRVSERCGGNRIDWGN